MHPFYPFSTDASIIGAVYFFDPLLNLLPLIPLVIVIMGYLKNPHEILRITCPKDESPFLTFFVILLHHYLRTGRLSSIWFSETVEKLISELPSKAQM
jgi:membrane-bound metal-dependent hydrolase YbcI (DUF457 family)